MDNLPNPALLCTRLLPAMARGYHLVLVMCAFLLATDARAQDQVDLAPAQDNSIYEESGSISNGSGSYLFLGNTAARGGTFSRRALLLFDVAGSVPEGVRVDSVNLALTMDKTISGEMPVDVHRLTAPWGEGSSDAGGEEGMGADAAADDATWTHRFFDTEMWQHEGGDFVGEASATFDVGGNDRYSVRSSSTLRDDVQMWLDDPDSNFGWILIGNESQAGTAKRFRSVEHISTDTRPSLTIYYSESTAAERPDVPASFVLEGGHPNPFHRTTVIRYALERPSAVTLRVYDVTGRPVRSVERPMQGAGPQQLEVSADGLASGLYLYCLSVDRSRECRTLTVLR